MKTKIWRPSQGLGQFRPSRELEEMGRQFEDDFIRPIVRAVWDRIPREVKEWSPSIDIFERNDHFEVKVELPDVKQEDIDLSLSDDTLTIRGARKPESNIKDEDYHYSEIVYGSFYRSVGLPSTVDTKNVEAAYENGILRITLHRAPEAKPKKVDIRVNKGTA
jgi:HSP20 family protein